MAVSLQAAELPKEILDKGKLLFFQQCLICHQMNGMGVPGTYPPLAKSDFLMSDRERSIRILCEGLNGEITVNNKKFNGYMPPVTLKDDQVAAVLSYVRNSWGNEDAVVTEAEVKAARAKTQWKTYEDLAKVNVYPPLPKPPEGFAIREVARLGFNPVRIASDHQSGVLYLLSQNGDVYRVEAVSGRVRLLLSGQKYLLKRPGDLGGPVILVAMTMDSQNRLYIGVNQQNGATKPVQNVVTIYRTSAFREGDPVDPLPWFETSYPGNAAYIHGLECIGFGPDGFLYASNGARTDANESGGDPNYYQGGETPVTSCFWRIDPNAEKPELEVYAKGIRNAYGFCWNDKGELFATENGPDAHANEELNLIEKGKHYGFPYRFADWTKKAYGHTPEPPPGLEFTLPIPNLGPDGGFYGKTAYTFDPHSSPGGIVALGGDFPPEYRGSLLLTRFGNFIRDPRDNVGYDLLQVRLKKNGEGKYEANVHTVLPALGRPTDVHLNGKGRIFVAEYSRGTNNATGYGMPGRLIELSVKPAAPAP